MIDENGDLFFILTDGVKLNMGQIAKSGAGTTATAALWISIVALLSHLGWIIPRLRKTKPGRGQIDKPGIRS